MTKVVFNGDCGNAPKKLFLRDFNIALASNDAETVLNSVSDNVEWITVGGHHIKGKKELALALEDMKRGPADELIIKTIITHGIDAAANGILKLDNGETYAFCDVYRFNSYGKNARLKSITTYVIPV